MNNDLEYNFIHTQINANNQIRALIQNDITTLSAMIQQKRQWLIQLDNIDNELNLRINSFNNKNKILVHHKIAEFNK